VKKKGTSMKPIAPKLERTGEALFPLETALTIQARNSRTTNEAPAKAARSARMTEADSPIRYP